MVFDASAWAGDSFFAAPPMAGPSTSNRARPRSVQTTPFPLQPILFDPNLNYPQWDDGMPGRSLNGWRWMISELARDYSQGIRTGLLRLFYQDGLVDVDMVEDIRDHGQEGWKWILEAMEENTNDDFHWSVLDHLHQTAGLSEADGKEIYRGW